MLSLAYLLAWKFDNAPGLRTRENMQTGAMEIFDWPNVLGPEPTVELIAQWQTDYTANPPEFEPTQVEIIEALFDKATAAPNEVAAVDTRIADSKRRLVEARVTRLSLV